MRAPFLFTLLVLVGLLACTNFAPGQCDRAELVTGDSQDAFAIQVAIDGDLAAVGRDREMPAFGPYCPSLLPWQRCNRSPPTCDGSAYQACGFIAC